MIETARFEGVAPLSGLTATQVWPEGATFPEKAALKDNARPLLVTEMPGCGGGSGPSISYAMEYDSGDTMSCVVVGGGVPEIVTVTGIVPVKSPPRFTAPVEVPFGSEERLETVMVSRTWAFEANVPEAGVTDIQDEGDAVAV